MTRPRTLARYSALLRHTQQGLLPDGRSDTALSSARMPRNGHRGDAHWKWSDQAADLMKLICGLRSSRSAPYALRTVRLARNASRSDFL